jgi:hypothetical protein
MNAFNFIAINSYGCGNCIIVSEKNYQNFDLVKLTSYSNYKFYFAPINDIIVYRNGDKNETGLKLVFCEDRYALVPVGLNPERNFCLIKINPRKKKLERILNL